MSAVFSKEPKPLYRYRLDRAISMFDGPHVAWLLHNPSTAADRVDDNTSRRCIGYAKAWNASKLTLVNPWAGIATHKRDLWQMDDPIGPLNDLHIEAIAREIASSNGIMVFAWGDVAPPSWLRGLSKLRLRTVAELIRDCGCVPMALAVTKAGDPCHPLMLPATLKPRPWPATWNGVARG